jgi:tellurite resistance protein
MSTPANATDEQRRTVLARLTDELDEALAGVEIKSAEVGDAVRQGRRLVVPVAVEVAEADEEADAAEEKNWSEEDPEGFEEAIEYLLEKNRELLQRLA